MDLQKFNKFYQDDKLNISIIKTYISISEWHELEKLRGSTCAQQMVYSIVNLGQKNKEEEKIPKNFLLGGASPNHVATRTKLTLFLPHTHYYHKPIGDRLARNILGLIGIFARVEALAKWPLKISTTPVKTPINIVYMRCSIWSLDKVTTWNEVRTGGGRRSLVQ